MQWKCCVCGNPIDGTDWVCHECARGHGLEVPVSQWPAWARELKRSEEAERRYHREWDGWLVSLDAVPDMLDRMAEQADGYARSRPLADRDLLQSSPYEDEDANRMYRKASGLE